MRDIIRRCAAFAALSLVGANVSGQAPSDELPQPLTLEHALAIADELSPAMAVAEAEVRVAHAARLAAQSRTGIDARIEGRLQWVEPSPVAESQGNEDHRIGLIVSKNLYDFGRSEAGVEAANLAEQGGTYLFLNARQQYRLKVMRRFFDVLLSDLAFLRDNEEMAVAYVQLDRLRQRRDLGEVSDLDVLEQEVIYQRARHQRLQSQNQQRATRSRLALALNRPSALPAELIMPPLPAVERGLPEVETLQEQALQNNSRLQALRSQAAAAQQRVQAARAGARPTLRGAVEAYDYSRQLGRDDTFRAGLHLDVPLFTGGAVDAAVAKEQAEVYRVQAQLVQLEHEIRQSVLDTWLELDSLRIRLQGVAALGSFRELYLDRSRALYEMEVKTDLGDSMVQLSEAQLQELQVKFEIELAWARMDALTGVMQDDGARMSEPSAAPASPGESG